MNLLSIQKLNANCVLLCLENRQCIHTAGLVCSIPGEAHTLGLHTGGVTGGSDWPQAYRALAQARSARAPRCVARLTLSHAHASSWS